MARTPDKFWETEEFAAMDRVWRERLRADGFPELEDDFPVAHARDLSRDFYRDRQIARRGEVGGLTEHMRRAGRWFHERVFPNLSRARMWAFYAEGIPRAELIERMGCLPGHQSWYVGVQLAEERRLMDEWYAWGGDPEDEVTLSLHDEHLAAEDFERIVTRGEGGGEEP